MKDFWAYIGTWSVLKWVLLVLVAGFIGHFGRMAAEAIVAKARAGREKKAPQREASQEKSMPTVLNVSTDSAGPDKKILKALVKARKKEAKKK